MLRISLLCVFSVLAAAQTVTDRATKILRQNCLPCHGAGLVNSGLDLRTREAALKGGERGSSLVPGKAEESRLYRFAAGLDEPSMPPGRKMSAADLQTLKAWIEAGAEWKGAAESAADAQAALARLEERPITAEERSWWAFQPIAQPVVPAATLPRFNQNPIDRFLAKKWREKGLAPSPRADRRTLLRRASLIVTGLAPSEAELNSFVADKSGDAWPKQVERLLASPQYGVRWARHWLDLVRYSDSGGYEYDRDRPNSWRYRDYVVNALNKDKPIDRFLQEQLAGDELFPGDTEARIGTGYLRMGPENNLKNEQTRLDELDDIVVTTSNALLGVTVGCARCHNHKFDPIPQKDYYRMQAIFFPLQMHDHELAAAEESKAWKARTEEIRAQQKQLNEQLLAIEKPHREAWKLERVAKLPAYMQEAWRTPAAQRNDGQKLNAEQIDKTLNKKPDDLMERLSANEKAAYEGLTRQVAELEKARPAALPYAMSIKEAGTEAPASHFLHRGSAGQKGSVMQPGVLSVALKPGAGDWRFEAPPAGSSSSWRRRNFALWLTDKSNPLVSRVFVNRLWQHHFGEGIVRTPSNFGRTGEKPDHPELLDWMATELMSKGWSMKHLHRLILNSEAFQMASRDLAAQKKIDPDNRMLWRMSRRRLEGEAIRDNILLAAGTLKLDVGGAAMHPWIDPALFQSSSERTWKGRQDDDVTTWRRSLYIFNKRSIPLPMLEVFDKPDGIGSCARRNRSTVAPQALILMNNASILLHTEKLAERIRKEAGSAEEKQVERAWQLALNRKPDAKELAEGIAFLRAGTERLRDYCQALVNSNEFAYIE
jgi:mono/diheme cytochrome c family protein